MTLRLFFLLTALVLLPAGARAAEEDHDHAGHDHAAHDGHAHADHKHAEHDGHAHAEHKHAEHDGHASHKHDGHDHEIVVVQVDARSRHILNMQIETIPDTGLALSQTLYGHLIVPGHALETYALPCAGRINLRVKTAQEVNKGDVLYSLTSPAYADQIAEVQSIQSNLERCWVEVEALRARIARLSEAGTRNSELENQLTFKVAEAGQLTSDQKIAQRRLKVLAMGAEQGVEEGLPVLLVRAHENGVVNNVGVTQNSWGEQGAPVITMSHPGAMEIVGTLYASDLPRISAVRAVLPLGRENIVLDGTWRMAEQADPATQTRRLYFTPEKLPTEARAGQLCRLDIYDAPAEPGLISVPDSALVKVGTDDVVFVELKEGEYAMVKVHAGNSKRGMTPVSGLRAGQRIVVKGGYELKYILPSEKEAKKAGHFHADGKFHEGDEEEEEEAS